MANACSPIRTGLEWADDLPSTHPDDYRLFFCPMEGDNEISLDNLPPLYRALDDRTVGKVLDLPGLKSYQRRTYWPRDFTKSGKLKSGRRSMGHAYTGTSKHRDKLKGGNFGIQPRSDTPYIPFSGGKPMAEYFSVGDLHRKVAGQETEIAQLHSTIAEKEVSITEMQQVIREQEERIRGVTALNTAADKEVGAQREKLAALHTRGALKESVGTGRGSSLGSVPLSRQQPHSCEDSSSSVSSSLFSSSSSCQLDLPTSFRPSKFNRKDSRFAGREYPFTGKTRTLENRLQKDAQHVRRKLVEGRSAS